MSTNPENFEELRRLLRWKRHEQPPPGYFDGFSTNVIAGIRTSGRTETLAHKLNEIPWLKRVLASFETKPIFAGAFGAAVCVLLVFGIIYAERVELNQTTGDYAVETPLPTTPFSVAASESLAPAPVLVASTNPAAFPGGSLFDQIQQLQAQPQPVSYGLPSGR